jgi:hypothetical protein
VPSIESLEKIAHALEVPIYRIFYDGENPPEPLASVKKSPGQEVLWGDSGKEAKSFSKFRRLLGRINQRDRRLLLSMAIWMALHPK